jgi:hypothetical protein
MARLSSATFVRNWRTSFSSPFGFANRDITPWTCLPLLLVLVLVEALSPRVLASRGRGRFLMVCRTLCLAHTLHADRRRVCTGGSPLVGVDEVRGVVLVRARTATAGPACHHLKTEGTTGLTENCSCVFSQDVICTPPSQNEHITSEHRLHDAYARHLNPKPMQVITGPTMQMLEPKS